MAGENRDIFVTSLEENKFTDCMLPLSSESLDFHIGSQDSPNSKRSPDAGSKAYIIEIVFGNVKSIERSRDRVSSRSFISLHSVFCQKIRLLSSNQLSDNLAPASLVQVSTVYGLKENRESTILQIFT
jgi:hypothetical protein